MKKTAVTYRSNCFISGEILYFRLNTDHKYTLMRVCLILDILLILQHDLNDRLKGNKSLKTYTYGCFVKLNNGIIFKGN